mgnify:CR=1 FL=1
MAFRLGFISNVATYIVLVLTTLTSDFAFANADRVTGKTFATRSEVIAANGMVATSQPLASQIGLQVLKDGGNAIVGVVKQIIGEH